jgi:hypothetical protein
VETCVFDPDDVDWTDIQLCGYLEVQYTCTRALHSFSLVKQLSQEKMCNLSKSFKIPVRLHQVLCLKALEFTICIVLAINGC